MGTALGFTLTQSLGVTFLVFTALGLGMAAPVLILSGSPALLKRIPKPGVWMETLKQSFGFLMAATALWLAWVLGQLVGANAVVSLGGLWLLMGVIAWVLGRWAVPHQSGRVRLMARAIAFVLLMTLLVLGWKSVPHQAGGSDADASISLAEGEEAFRPGIVEELRASGKPWFLHYTAAWCLSCKVNEFNALNREAVQTALHAKGVRHVKADWTSKDSVIAASLASFGRQGVPFYVLSDGKTETILPEVLTEQIVLDAVAKIPASP
jgi:thiol:disulfide interchange protein DsbD